MKVEITDWAGRSRVTDVATAFALAIDKSIADDVGRVQRLVDYQLELTARVAVLVRGLAETGALDRDTVARLVECLWYDIKIVD